MEDDGSVVHNEPEFSSPESVDWFGATRRFFSDSDPEELDEIDIDMREDGQAVSVVDLCSSSEDERDSVEAIDVDSDSGKDGGDIHADHDMDVEMSERESSSSDESQDGYVADDDDFNTDSDDEHEGMASQKAGFIKDRGADIRRQVQILEALHAKGEPDLENAARASDAKLREEVEAHKLLVQAVRVEITMTKSAFAAYPDETKEVLARFGLSPYTTKECFDAIYSAYAVAKRLAAPATAEVRVLDKWAIESWASESRLMWSAKRYPDAEPALTSTAGLTQTWKQLVTPDTHPQRQRTVVRVEDIRKLSKGVAVIKRSVLTALGGLNPAKTVDKLSVVFVTYDSESFCVGVASIPDSRPPGDTREAAPTDCQCWIFSPSLLTSGWDVQYIGYYDVESQDGVSSASLVDDMELDVVEVLQLWESHFEEEVRGREAIATAVEEGANIEHTSRVIEPHPLQDSSPPPMLQQLLPIYLTSNTPTSYQEACEEAIKRASSTVSSLMVPVDRSTGKSPRTNVVCSTNWRTVLWATGSRLNWRSQRYMNAVPQVTSPASVERAWELLTMPDTQKRRYRTVERVQVLSSFGDRNVVLKRSVVINMRRQRSRVDQVSLAFHFRSGSTYYVCITSLPASVLGASNASATDECECWVFTPTSNSEANGGWDALYLGSCAVLGGDARQPTAALSQAAMDVVETLPLWERHLN